MKKKRKWWVKLLIVLMAVMVISAIATGVWYVSVTGALSKVYASNEVTTGSGAKTALIIYQPSSNDTTSNVTSELAKQIADEDYTVTINNPSEALTYDVDMYDVIAFGTPVYMGKVSSVLESYVKSLSIEGKQVLLYATGMNLDVTDELSTMANWISDNNVIDAIKIGNASPDIIAWFISQWEDNTPEEHFTIHNPASTGIDTITGATMKQGAK